jgi:hypothetical protein
MFDLIHLIGNNFIQAISSPSDNVNITLKKRNQQILLEKIIQKLTSAITLSNSNAETMSSSRNNSSNVLAETANANPANITNVSSNGQSSSSSVRRSNMILLNLTRNKLALMALCAQYVEPDDIDLFNEFYTSILCSITSILLNESINFTANNSSNEIALAQTNCDSIEMMSQKFSIILQLISKFSFFNLNKLITNEVQTESDSKSDEDYITNICTAFVETNLNFLFDLKFEFLNQSFQLSPSSLMSPQDQERLQQRQLIKENNLRLIIDQCIDNFVSILNVEYPFYFEYMLKKCLEFSSKTVTLKYGTRHLKQFNQIFKQNELMSLSHFGSEKKTTEPLTKVKYEKTFDFLKEYFNFERSRFRSQKRSFYAHWCTYSRELADIYASLFTAYFDRFVVKDLIISLTSSVGPEETPYEKVTELANKLMKTFEKKYDELWGTMLNLYLVWIEPASVKEVTSQSLINVKEIYENEIAVVGRELQNSAITSPGAAVLLIIDSFLLAFHAIFERLNMFVNVTKNSQLGQLLAQNAKNYVLNKLFHFYYEQIACALSSTSSINDNTLDCYHRCMGKYSSSWFGIGQFEPDYRSINIMSELCWAPNTRLVKFLAYDLVSYLDLSRISESYFRKMEIMPMQINDLLKCWLQLLTEFCLRDNVRESAQFDTLLRPIYNQAEVLQCWSMLSDTSYSDVVMQRFCALADYRYAFASRGVDRGLLINILKSSAEFYSLAYRNSLSCFSSAKRRCYLKAICELLLKPTAQTIKADNESFQNCILNLLTDIETFSISASDDPSGDSNLKHQIQLLIDEFLFLISSNQNKQAAEIYTSMFESWICSSRDSPILLHLINRLSRNYNLLTTSVSNEKYCNLIELCLEVYFETNRSNIDTENSLTLSSSEESQSWKSIMDDVDFKMYGFDESNKTNDNELFEFKCLQNSSYLLLNAYMTQRLAVFKAANSENSIEFLDSLIKYSLQVLSSFFNETIGSPNQKNAKISRLKLSKEEKFILIVNKLLEFYLLIKRNLNSSLMESKLGEQLVKLSNLLSFYGEDTLSNQNPMNDSQSYGSDLLSSIGLNILSKKSQFSIQFRFYCRAMAICLLKQILIVSNESPKSSTSSNETASTELFPNLNQLSEHSSPTGIPGAQQKQYLYKIRMTHADVSTNFEAIGMSEGRMSPSSSTTSLNKISSSLPNSSFLSPTKSSQNSQINLFNQQFKLAAYQFHLIFQTKAYSSITGVIESANYVNQHLQNSQHFCLPQVFNMSKQLCCNLFKEKYYLF